ncbi:preprotein translocase subunit SecG [Roseiarcaceae bacterium H3SJ34-1]|uniref:preprotein translocase subunit SecG n=1 Tax=Terripilifer ovatus TaxID=3032367 RepID=UPI003AB9A37B|nr:preprotein translocase subunit SecG [Roseiarcaceae bacterium H3SJ34-1]
MDTVLIVVHLMVVIALVVVVLLQRSEGGALGIGGGGGFMTGRGQANALTKATGILGTLFFLTSLTLTVLANIHRAPRSVLDGAAPTTTSAPAQPGAPGQAPSGGSMLDQLRGIDNRSTAPAPAPSAPAAPQPPQR